MLLSGCGGSKEEGKKAAPSDPYNTKGVKAGDSCKGIDKDKGLVACDGMKSLGCSSFTGYKWTVVTECEEGTKCVVEGPDMTSCS